MKRPCVLLIQPPIHDFNAFDLWTRPLGWLKLGACLEAAGAEVHLLDVLDRYHPIIEDLPPRRHRFNRFGCGHYQSEIIPKPSCLQFVPRQFKRFGIPLERFREGLSLLDPPDIILCGSTMTYWYPGLFEAIREVHTLWPDVPVGVCGIYAMLCPEHAEKYSGADFVYSGHDLEELVNWIGEKAGANFEPFHIPDHGFIVPAFHLMTEQKSLPLQTSSGCVYDCSYCASRKLQPGFRQYPVELLIEMLEDCADKYQTTDWAFYDDALLIRKEKHFIPFLEAIIQKDFSFQFHVPNALHSAPIDKQVADLMKATGFETLRLGLEFSQEARMKETGGKVKWAEYQNAVRCLLDAGFSPGQLGTYIMIGYPGQTPEEMRECCRRVHEQGSPIRLAMYSPIPGTRDFSLDYSDWCYNPSDDPLLHNCSLTPFRSKTFPYEEYQDLKQKVKEWNGVLIASSKDTES